MDNIFGYTPEDVDLFFGIQRPEPKPAPEPVYPFEDNSFAPGSPAMQGQTPFNLSVYNIGGFSKATGLDPNVAIGPYVNQYLPKELAKQGLNPEQIQGVIAGFLNSYYKGMPPKQIGEPSTQASQEINPIAPDRSLGELAYDVGPSALAKGGVGLLKNFQAMQESGILGTINPINQALNYIPGVKGIVKEYNQSVRNVLEDLQDSINAGDSARQKFLDQQLTEAGKTDDLWKQIKDTAKLIADNPSMAVGAAVQSLPAQAVLIPAALGGRWMVGGAEGTQAFYDAVAQITDDLDKLSAKDVEAAYKANWPDGKATSYDDQRTALFLEMRKRVLPIIASTSTIGAIFGGFETGLVRKQAEEIVDKVVKKSLLKQYAGGIGKAAISEGPEEFGQSGAEQFWQNIAKQVLNPNQSPLEGVGSQAVQGAGAGIATGGAFSAGHVYTQNRGITTTATPPPPPGTPKANTTEQDIANAAEQKTATPPTDNLPDFLGKSIEDIENEQNPPTTITQPATVEPPTVQPPNEPFTSTNQTITNPQNPNVQSSGTAQGLNSPDVSGSNNTATTGITSGPATNSPTSNGSSTTVPGNNGSTTTTNSGTGNTNGTSNAVQTGTNSENTNNAIPTNLSAAASQYSGSVNKFNKVVLAEQQATKPAVQAHLDDIHAQIDKLDLVKSAYAYEYDPKLLKAAATTPSGKPIVFASPIDKAAYLLVNSFDDKVKNEIKEISKHFSVPINDLEWIGQQLTNHVEYPTVVNNGLDYIFVPAKPGGIKYSPGTNFTGQGVHYKDTNHTSYYDKFAGAKSFQEYLQKTQPTKPIPVGTHNADQIKANLLKHSKNTFDKILTAVNILPGAKSLVNTLGKIKQVGARAPANLGSDFTKQELEALAKANGYTDAQLKEKLTEYKITAKVNGGKKAYDKAKAAGKTKLTYKQWVYVRTPSFKQWFGDWENDPDGPNTSKIRDFDTGEPLVIYRGTGGATKPTVGTIYDKGFGSTSYTTAKDYGHVIAVFVKALNVAEFYGNNSYWSQLKNNEQFPNNTDYIAKEFNKNGIDAVMFYDVNDPANGPTISATGAPDYANNIVVKGQPQGDFYAEVKSINKKIKAANNPLGFVNPDSDQLYFHIGSPGNVIEPFKDIVEAYQYVKQNFTVLVTNNLTVVNEPDNSNFGWYDPKTKKAYVNFAQVGKNREWFDETVIHEMVHWALQNDALASDAMLNTHYHGFLEQIKQLYYNGTDEEKRLISEAVDTVAKYPEFKKEYHDIDDFITDIGTGNKLHQEFLAHLLGRYVGREKLVTQKSKLLKLMDDALRAIETFIKKYFLGVSTSTSIAEAINKFDLRTLIGKALDDFNFVAFDGPTQQTTTQNKFQNSPITVLVPEGNTYTKIGPQAGTNPGGWYKNQKGTEVYAKFLPIERIENELLANRLYSLLGIDVPATVFDIVDGKPALVSYKIYDLKEGDHNPKIAKGFLADAWLGNWDVVGKQASNIGTANTDVYRIDNGGALLYRAQGTPKGETFGDKVKEIQTLRDPNINPDAAKIFGGPLAIGYILDGIHALQNMTNNTIIKMVDSFITDPKVASKLAQTLIARRDDIFRQLDVFKGVSPYANTKVIDKVQQIFGPSTSTSTSTQLPTSYGGIVVDATGKNILLRKPTNNYGGYSWTFPKGHPNKGETPEQAALREVKEETGYTAKIIGKLPGSFKGDTTHSEFFIMEVDPSIPQVAHDSETERVKFFSYDEAKKAIEGTTTLTGKKRDLAILEAFNKHQTSTQSAPAQSAAAPIQKMSAGVSLVKPNIPAQAATAPTPKGITQNVQTTNGPQIQQPNNNVAGTGQNTQTAVPNNPPQHAIPASTGGNAASQSTSSILKTPKPKVIVKDRQGLLQFLVDDAWSLQKVIEGIEGIAPGISKWMKEHDVLRRDKVRNVIEEGKEKYYQPILTKYLELQKLYNVSKEQIDEVVTAIAGRNKALYYLENNKLQEPELVQNAQNGLAKAEASIQAADPALFNAIVAGLNPLLKNYSDFLVDEMLRYGRIDQTTADDFKQRFASPKDYGLPYLPMQWGDSSTVFKEEKGLSFGGDNPVERLVDHMVKLAVWGENNFFRQQFYKLALMVDVVGENSKKSLLRPQPKEKVIKDAQGNVFFGNGVDANSKDMIPVWENGVVRKLEITDKPMLHALDRVPHSLLDAERITATQLAMLTTALNALKIPTQVLGRMYTAYSATFAATNLVRDFGDMIAFMPKGISRAAAIKNYPKAFTLSLQAATAEYANGTPPALYTEARKAGALITVPNIYGFDTVKKSITKELQGRNELGKEALAKADETLGFISQVLENTTRLAVYLAAKESGKNVREAAVAAKTTTVNFQRTSQFARLAGPLFLFVNPSIQGSRTLIRNVKEGNPNTIQAGVALALIGFLSALFGNDKRDEEGASIYKKIPQNKRDRSIIAGDYAFPLQYGVNLPYVFGNIMGDIISEGHLRKEQSKSSMLDEAKDGGVRLFNNLVDVFYPLNSPKASPMESSKIGTSEYLMRFALPLLAQPAFDLTANHTTFGQPIKPKTDEEARKKGIPAHLNYQANIDPMYKDAAQKLYDIGGIDVSPSTLRYFDRYFTGSAGEDARTLLELFQTGEIKPRYEGQDRRPILKNFTANPAPFADQQEWDNVSQELRGMLADFKKNPTAEKREKYGKLLILAEQFDQLDKEHKKFFGGYTKAADMGYADFYKQNQAALVKRQNQLLRDYRIIKNG